MKPTHILAIIAIAVAIGIITSTAGDASTYVNFNQAISLAKDNAGEAVHVVGKVKKNAAGQIENAIYDPQIDPNHFEFTLVDNAEHAERVVFNSPKPQDFDRSEQIVVIGSMQKEHFQCDKILLKCPSKYQDGKLETTEHSAQPRPAKTTTL